jgi:hypothetical protein
VKKNDAVPMTALTFLLTAAGVIGMRLLLTSTSLANVSDIIAGVSSNDV